MIRITDSKNHTAHDFEMISNILCAGLTHFCTKDCKNCEVKRVCSSVYSAAGYALILAGKHNT